MRIRIPHFSFSLGPFFSFFYDYDYDYDYDLIQGKGDACKPAQYIVTLLLYPGQPAPLATTPSTEC